MNFRQLVSSIKSELGNLPGMEAHQKMMPDIRFPLEEFKGEPIDAGVLILLFPANNNISTVLMKRNVYPGPHSGQISFPGGKKEDNDNSIIDTAIREAKEEIGINTNKIEIIGKLTPLFIPVSNFNVVPVVGFANTKPNFNPDRSEVEEIIITSIDELIKPSNLGHFYFTREDKKIKAPCYFIEKHKIWGATAMILCELLFLIQKINANELAN